MMGARTLFNKERHHRVNVIYQGACNTDMAEGVSGAAQRAILSNKKTNKIKRQHLIPSWFDATVNPLALCRTKNCILTGKQEK
jgi:hypothetical protein